MKYKLQQIEIDIFLHDYLSYSSRFIFDIKLNLSFLASRVKDAVSTQASSKIAFALKFAFLTV